MAHGQANAEILDNICPTLTLIHEPPIVVDPLDTMRDVVLQKHFTGYRAYKGIAPTLTGMNKGNYRLSVLGGPRPRRLTPVEFERLQGFPDNWTFSGIKNGKPKKVSDRQRYKQLGNAVTVNVAEWIGDNIMHMED